MLPKTFFLKQLELFQKKYFEIEQELREIEVQIASFGKRSDTQSSDFLRIQKKMKFLMEKQKIILNEIQKVNFFLKKKPLPS